MTTKQSGAIGILGGVFNPVHNGHLAVAQLALEHFSLSRVMFVPSGIPPHKIARVSVSPEQRLEILQLALRDNPLFEAWDEEIRRGGVSYTIDTLSVLEQQFPGAKQHFLIGSDNLKEIASWRRYREILKKVVLCVVHRPGYGMKVPPGLGEVRIRHCPSPEWGVSSTMIRTMVGQGLSAKYLVPPQVETYIRRHGLYRG